MQRVPAGKLHARARDQQTSTRPLTILFCDVVGSTALTTEVELETARDLIHNWQSIAARTIETQGGFVARFMGDGVLAYFGYPDILEDDAERAVHTGFKLLAEAGAIAAARPLQIRVGIASGPVIVERRIGTGSSAEIPVYGPAPNLAARLLARAPPNGVVLDERTRLLLGDLFDFEPLGLLQLKGFKKPVAAFQVVRPRQSRSRFASRRATHLTPFIGRGTELEVLLESANRAARAGLHLVIATGGAGVGKSRLLHEATEILRASPRALLHGDCAPGRRDAPFAPLVNAFRLALRPSPNDPGRSHLGSEPPSPPFSVMAGRGPAAPGSQSGGGHDDIVSSTNAIAWPSGSGATGAGPQNPEDPGDPHFAALLELLDRAAATDRDGMGNPLMLRRRIHDLMRQVLTEICARHQAGALLVIEDVHWIDQSSREFLVELLRTGTALPLFLLVSSRNPVLPDWVPSELPRERLRLLELHPLSEAETASLLESRGGVREIAPSTISSIVKRSGGNPLFAEELLSHLSEADEPQDMLGVPDNVMQITASRLDRLNGDVRSLLSAAAIIGPRFPLDVLARVAELPADKVGEVLDTQTHDLVHRIEGQPDHYAFRHALIQEAVSASLLPSGRRHIHAQIARVLEQSGGAEAHAEALAYHYLEAGAPDLAVESLLAAGSKRLAIYALDEADLCFRSALELAEQADSPAHTWLAQVMAKRMRLLDLRCAYREIAIMSERLLPVLDRQPVSHEFCLVLGHYAHALLHAHDYPSAERIATRALRLAEEIHAPLPAALSKLALMRMWITHAKGNTSRDIEDIAIEIIAAAEAMGDSYLSCKTHFQLAVHYLASGDLPRARAAAAALEDQGARFNDPRAESFARWLLGWIMIHDCQFETVLTLAEQSLRSAVTDLDRTISIVQKGGVLASTGKPLDALALLLPAHKDALARGDLNFAATIELAIGIAMVGAGRLLAGLRYLNSSIKRREAEGCLDVAFYGRLILGEICTAFASSRPSSPAFSTSSRLLTRCIQPILRRWASYYLDSAARNECWGPWSVATVRILIARARLLAHRDFAGASALLAQARAIADEIGCEGLAHKAAAALARLEARTNKT